MGGRRSHWFFCARITGTARLQNVRAKVRGLNGPIEISSAQLQLSRDAIRVDKLIAREAALVGLVP